MVDSQPSSNMDDLFDFGVPATGEPAAEAVAVTHYGSRREARAAEEAAANRKAEVVPAASRAVHSTPVHSTPLAAPAETISATAAPRKAAPSGPARRKLKRAELALVRASHPKPPRKNAFSVLITMAAVGGMFAVAGLPAYALTPATNSNATATGKTTQADAQSVLVSTDASALTVTRDGFHATSQDQLNQILKDALRAQQNEAYNASGARAMGDDYPWPYELMENQGGGLSPLNYYYRECVDFVAWRLNRDAGSYQAPFKWVWSNLTPYGGDGSQWMYNWQQHGWPVSNVPIVGAVAYTGGNHVAYVKAVNANGTVTIEEYNYIHGQYGQRTLPSTSIVAFLYPPPA